MLLVLLLGLGLVPSAAAQDAGRVYRLGFLASGGSAANKSVIDAFRDGLRELGWTEGRNITIEYRFAEGRFDRLASLADELVRANVDIIFASPSPAALAAHRATRTIPIVMASVADPVALGIVQSLRRPGGNVTGTSYSFDLDIFAKHLQLLHEAVPSARKVAVLWNPGNPGHVIAVRNVGATARSLGIALHFVEAREPENLESAFADMDRQRAQAVLVMSDSLFGTYATELAALTSRYRLPSIHGARSNVEAGGLMLYGPNIPRQARQAAAYVDKILKGAKPSDLPVEQPTTFDLVVNPRTAKQLGIELPASLMLRAETLP
ncbi:MAG TPA: ABC transporter substrate-binding protein [Casimicrobiaceae bacterium]|nr:ABC transporter substrate-binding protein [Casimicrobiaceae bacterium]